METLHRQAYFVQEKQQNIQFNFSNSSLPSASSSSFTESLEDLLPDLWLEPTTTQGQFQNATLQRPNSNYHLVNVPHNMQGTNTVMLRDASLEYAQSLLPHSLLAPLTEENLDYNMSVDRDEMFDFEQQQAQQQNPHSNHQHHHHRHKSRQNLVLSTSSTKGKNINTQLYKTELCVLFMKMGVCPYGNKCQFAHGEQDLKRVERPANWRLKPCVNWAKYGSCRYGKRCCFKHGD